MIKNPDGRTAMEMVNKFDALVMPKAKYTMGGSIAMVACLVPLNNAFVHLRKYTNLPIY